MIMLTPGQTHKAIGAQLLALGTIALGNALRNQWRVFHSVRITRGRFVARLPTMASYVATLVAAISLLTSRFGGFYWVAAATYMFFGATFFNSWQLMVHIGDEEKAANINPIETIAPN